MRVRRCNRSRAGPLVTSTSIQNRVPPHGPVKVLAVQRGSDYMFLLSTSLPVQTNVLWEGIMTVLARQVRFGFTCPGRGLVEDLRLGKYGRWVWQVQRVTKQQVTRRQAVEKLMLAIVSAELSLDLQTRRHGQCANADSWSVFARMFPVMCMSGLSRSCYV